MTWQGRPAPPSHSPAVIDRRYSLPTFSISAPVELLFIFLRLGCLVLDVALEILSRPVRDYSKPLGNKRIQWALDL